MRRLPFFDGDGDGHLLDALVVEELLEGCPLEVAAHPRHELQPIDLGEGLAWNAT
ncbi:MAG: hypothetical protein IPM43_01740 [Actinomycetota bacterium]|nr:MAG: hypothetical protein IPM43_01740 [Actinomycetota bacterium]